MAGGIELALFSALFDANVLYSVPVTDLVMELASTGLFRALWSDDISEEWVRNVTRDRPDLSPQKIASRRESMDLALPYARVSGHQALIAGLSLPDPDDRHVWRRPFTATPT